MEAGRHLQAQRNRGQDKQNRHDPGVVGGGDRRPPRRAQAGRQVPTGVLFRRSNRASNRPLVRGGLSQPTARRKQSDLASLLP